MTIGTPGVRKSFRLLLGILIALVALPFGMLFEVIAR